MAKTVGYVGMLLGAVAVVLFIQRVGPATQPTLAPPGAATHTVVHLLLTLLLVVALGRVIARLIAPLGQPAVVAEIIAGLMLGALGAQKYVAPALPVLGAVSQLGIVLYMFAVGLTLDGHVFSGKTRAMIAISHASIVVPFVCGTALALYAYPRFGSQASFTVFSLFIGIALAITAFPVLARILTDRGLEKTPLGALALACAATDDVTAWILLAAVVGAARADLSGTLPLIALTAVYALVMWFGVRPLLRRVTLTQPLLLCGMLASALATEAIGIHAIFGAFFMGALVPSEAPAAVKLRESIDSVVGIIFLPAFFAFTGMRTELGLVSSWPFAMTFIAVAVLGKLSGAAFAARITGSSWRDAYNLGVLMNTRGLMELVVLNIGRELGILSPELFTIGVVMALVTTMMTGPLLRVGTRDAAA